MLVYKIWIQYTNLFKSYGTETIFQSWKMAITPKIIGGFYPKLNDLHFMIIYLCIKIESNTLIFSKDIERKPFFKVEKFSKLKKIHNSENNLWILPSIDLDLHFLIIYLCIKFQSNTPIFSKDIAQKAFVLHMGRVDGTDVCTESGDNVCPAPPPLKMAGYILYAPPLPPHWKWRGHKKKKNEFKRNTT